MKRYPPLRFPTVLGAVVLVALVAVGAYAQIQSGNIYGKVQAKDGSVLPGVTVTLTGVGAPQTFVTDPTGSFRFLGLSPGRYNLKADLSGFGTATRQGVTVNIGRNADVMMTMAPAASESITVTAEAPLLDTRKTGTGSSVPQVELANVPTARDPWVILQQTPGIVMDRNNVGGNESGQQSVYISKGSASAQNAWNVDGVNITDFGATGSSPSYYDFDAFEEMQITTGGTDPRIQTPGAQLNMVTKRGTNELKGSARFFYENHNMQATPKIPSEAKPYLSYINQIESVGDRGIELGGPLWKDKLWGWGSFGRNDIHIETASFVAGQRFLDKTLLKNETLKLNAQPIPSNSLTLADEYGAKIKLGRNVGSTRPPETAWNQNDYYNGGVGSLASATGGSTGSLKNPTLWKIEDTQLIGSNVYLTGLYSHVQGGFQLIADNGKGCQTIQCGVDVLPFWYDEQAGTYRRTYVNQVINRPQKQYRLDGSAFANTGSISHELKFGYGYREATVSTLVAYPGGQWTDNYAIAGIKVGPSGRDTGKAHFYRTPLGVYGEKNQDLYISDTVMFGNLTVQGGLRHDNQKGFVNEGTAPANPTIPDILPTLNFSAQSGVSWNNLSPRLGLTYALGAEKRSLLRGSYARYVNQINSGIVSPLSPGAIAQAVYYFNDLNGDNVAQPNEIDFAAGPIGSLPTTVATVSTTRLDSHGVKAPITDELILGGEHELIANLSVGVNVTYRKLKDFTESVGEHTQGAGDFYGPNDYVLSPNALIATLPNGNVVNAQYYVLKSGVPAPKYSVIRNRPGYYQQYKGLEFNATKRLSNRWMLRGNVTLQDWTQHSNASTVVDPTKTRYCTYCNGSAVIVQSGGSGAKDDVYINSKWAYSVTGTYTIPVIETNLGFNLNGRQGYAMPYVGAVRTSEGAKSLLLPSDPDSYRNATVTELDLRLAKDIRILSRVGMTLSVDGFNMLNSNTILQRNVGSVCSGSTTSTKCTATPTSNRVTEVLSPRVFRVGARFAF